jgi:hypothetical protein
MLSILVFGLALALVGPRSFAGQGTGTAEADWPGATSALIFAQTCTAPNAVQVNLGWTASHQGTQWVDMSPFDNGFIPGTFNAVGPLSADQGSLLWGNLQPNTVYFVRVNTLTPWGWMPSFAVFVTTGCQQVLGLFNQPSLDDHRVSCERANGHWDGIRCNFVRFIFDFDRNDDHHRDHDRDRDRDCDRDRHDNDWWDRDNCDRDRDHDRDDCDRGGNNFSRDRNDDCDNDHGHDNGGHDNDDRDGHDNDDHNGPRPCQDGMVMIDGRCRPM